MSSLLSASNSLHALGRRGAVATGAAVALISLLARAPVRVACLRGGLALLACLLVARVVRQLVLHSLKVDRSAAADTVSGR